jgi:hypothetical protein
VSSEEQKTQRHEKPPDPAEAGCVLRSRSGRLQSPAMGRLRRSSKHDQPCCANLDGRNLHASPMRRPDYLGEMTEVGLPSTEFNFKIDFRCLQQGDPDLHRPTLSPSPNVRVKVQ